jgi:hypothetical protein
LLRSISGAAYANNVDADSSRTELPLLILV